MSIKEEIHALSDEMITNLGRLVAIDSQLGTPAEGMPFGEGPAKALFSLIVSAAPLKLRNLTLLMKRPGSVPAGHEAVHGAS